MSCRKDFRVSFCFAEEDPSMETIAERQENQAGLGGRWWSRQELLAAAPTEPACVRLTGIAQRGPMEGSGPGLVAGELPPPASQFPAYREGV